MTDMLTTAQAADRIGVSKSTLETWRHESRGPRYIKASPRLVRYRASDVADWVADREVTHDLAYSGTDE